jgi:uncharacterized membrane protein (UPF0127 family)
MTRTLLVVALLATCFDVAAAPCDPAQAQIATLPETELDVMSGAKSHRFRVWIADTVKSRTRGLMHVPDLPADRGMLFLFERAQFVVFWMKDTCVSLDILFVTPGGRIANIARNTEPFSLAPIVSSASVVGVLEIPAGTAQRLGIVPGDRIRHPAFETGQ